MSSIEDDPDKGKSPQATNGSIVLHRVGSFPIGQRVTDGYVNGTILCQATGKLIGHYLENATTKEFLRELERSIGIPIDLLVQKNRTGPNEERGTWVHPQVAVNLAQWCSPRFAVMVSQWVYNWLAGGRVPKNPSRQAVYPARLALAFKMMLGVPEGYWTVFDKCSSLLILVECELKLPIDRYDLLDGSVGIHWSKFRKGEAWAGERTRYQHIFPDNRGIQEAWAYPLQELAHFDHWLRTVYIPIHLPAYLDTKYKLAVPPSRLLAKALGSSRLPPQN